MKRIFALMLAFAVVFAMAAPASAVTTGNWDWGSIYDHVDWGNVGTTNPTTPTEPEEPEVTTQIRITYDFTSGSLKTTKTVKGTWGLPSYSYPEYKDYAYKYETHSTAKDTYHTVVSYSANEVYNAAGLVLTGWEYNGKVYEAGDKILVADSDMVLSAVWSAK